MVILVVSLIFKIIRLGENGEQFGKNVVDGHSTPDHRLA
jgi:hypothetical protein